MRLQYQQISWIIVNFVTGLRHCSHALQRSNPHFTYRNGDYDRKKRFVASSGGSAAGRRTTGGSPSFADISSQDSDTEAAFTTCSVHRRDFNCETVVFYIIQGSWPREPPSNWSSKRRLERQILELALTMRRR